MKTLIRRLFLVLLVLFLILVGAYFFIDSLVKAGIESGATSATGVRTTLGGVSIGLFSGQFSMQSLQLDNPDGFDSDHFLTLDKGEVAMNLGSLLGDEVVIPSLALDKIDINLEEKNGRLNFKTILDNLKQVSSGPDDPKPDDGKRYIIEELRITNIKVTATVGGAPIPIAIDKIVLTDVGSGKNQGVSMGQISGIILTAIFESLAENANDVLPNIMSATINSGLEGLGELGELGSSTLEKVGKGLSEGWQNILGGAKKEEPEKP
jgi:uncharacterized protein involved in outer membrane biogenesis